MNEPDILTQRDPTKNLSIGSPIFNDPIYGFIGIPYKSVFDLIEHPYFQRLRRIGQMGLSYLVYPGAHHTRFHHALGSMHLMQQAIRVLRSKKVTISEEEEEGLLVAILLHDIGHGPFSHAMEHCIVEGVRHEIISQRFMAVLRSDFPEVMPLALDILKGIHPRNFMNQLVSGQLDMDRMDYLKRDSFYTGVPEGNINSERLIAMLNVVDGDLVVEEKGVYSVEKFLVARRFMYWQVYLHKTGLVAEQLIIRTLKRAKELLAQGMGIECSPQLLFFLTHRITVDNFDDEVLHRFAELDDIDILGALKRWQGHDDFVLSELSKRLINRRLLHVKIKDKPIKAAKITKRRNQVARQYALSDSEVSYFVFTGEIENRAYDPVHRNINIVRENGKIMDVAKASDHLNLMALSKTVRKYYYCYPKK